MKYLFILLLALTGCKPAAKLTAICVTPLGVIQAQESTEVKVKLNGGKTAVTVSDGKQSITVSLSNCTIIEE